MHVGKNRFNKDTIIPGWFINYDGELWENSSFFTTDYIPVTPGNHVALSYKSNGFFMVFYGIDLSTKVSVINTVSIGDYIDVPPGAYFMRTCGPYGVLNTLQVEYGDSSTAYEPFTWYKELKIDYSIDFLTSRGIAASAAVIIKAQIDKFKNVGKNLFDKKSATLNTLIDNASGRIISFNNYFITEFIPVEAGRNLALNYKANGVFINFYDSSLSKISTINTADIGDYITVPNNAAFLLGCAYMPAIDTYQIEYADAPTAYEAFNNTPINYSTFKLKYDGVIDLKNEYANVKSETLLHMIKDVKVYNAVRDYTYSISYFLRNHPQLLWQVGIIAINNSTGVKTKMNFQNRASSSPYINITDLKNVTVRYENIHGYWPSAEGDDYTPFFNVIFDLTIDATLIEDGTGIPTNYDTNNILPISETCISFTNPPDRFTLAERKTITVKRYGTSGVDADYCGLNAIGDAINSINDASERKIYDIVVDGHFKFTDPSQFIYGNPYFGSHTIVGLKNYVNLVGQDKNRAIIEVAFDENTVFPEGETYMDYQPIYINTISEIRNCTIIGDACRYVVHIEFNNIATKRGEKLIFDNCTFISKDSVGQRTVNIFGTGGGTEYDWLIKNCSFRCDGHYTHGLAYHTRMVEVPKEKECSHITFENCDFDFVGNLLALAVYVPNRQDVINIVGSRIGRRCTYVGSYTAENFPKEIGTMPQINIDNEILPTGYSSSECAIRIIGKDGVNKIRFANTDNNAVIAIDQEDDTVVNTDWGAIKTLGYEYKDSTNGKNAYACSYKNIGSTTGTTLGARLGDCSSTNKTLRIVIDNTNYDVVFNQDMTNVSNDDIVAQINSVISSVATCDLFDPTKNYFPNYKNISYNITTSEDLITKGMGVVFTGIDSVRKAKRSDDKIDGVALDNIAQGQTGRIGGKGYYMNLMQSANIFNNIYPILNGLVFGNYLSIDDSNDGQFIVSDAKPVMKVIDNKCIELL